MLLPAALRFSCQILFIARPPSWMASDEPVVAVPIACLADGACHISARMEMPCRSIVSIKKGDNQTKSQRVWRASADRYEIFSI